MKTTATEDYCMDELYTQVLSKFDKKCRKHQDFIYLCLWVQYSLLCKDLNANLSHMTVLRGDISCQMLMKLREKCWIYDQIYIYIYLLTWVKYSS